MAATRLTLVEKIVQRYAGTAGSGGARQGQFVRIRPAHVMTHDNTSAVLAKFRGLSAAGKVRDAGQPVFTADHNVQDRSPPNLAKYAAMEKFARENGVAFFPPGRGIGHQVLLEEGYAFPNTMAVASDSHSNMYGGVGCLGTPIVRTDAAAIWATGNTWWQVPPVSQVDFRGELKTSHGVTGKDVIITLCALFNKDEVLNHALEFTGASVRNLSVDDRLTIANMTTEWGALAGLFPCDDLTINYLLNLPTTSTSHPRMNPARINALAEHPLRADSGALYAKRISFDLSSVSPHVSGPNSVKLATPVAELEKKNIRIHKAYLVSCVNSRLSDLQKAAHILRGRKVHQDVEMYISPASAKILEQAKADGTWDTLLAAGAIPLPSGCGPCIGLGAGLLQKGEVGISATNRNFKGRMGSREAECYLSNPEVVASSAVVGRIVGPKYLEQNSAVRIMADPSPKGWLEILTRDTKDDVSTEPAEIEVIDGFPETIQGGLLVCDEDNINTDGIYAGKYTYREDVSPTEMAKVAMENFDPEFQNIVREGDVLLSGFNFGTGSSREQAATALRYAGIKLILAGSFSETFKRNSLNNGLLCLECPQLIEDVRQSRLQEDNKTFRMGELEIQLLKGVVLWKSPGQQTKSYAVNQVGTIAQELIVRNGLEGWIRAELQSSLSL